MEKIIIDCDPGVDDAVALMLAFSAAQQLQVVGVTTVAGNLPLPQVTENALRIVESLGSEVSVYAGCARAIFPGPPLHSSVHGDDGLGNSPLAASTRQPAAQHAVDFIIDAVRARPGEITLCLLGPMTNIALALIKAPDIADSIRQIVAMGGALFCPGNITPAAEFNIACDPHAAQVVLSSGVPLTLYGLDVTRQARLTPEWLAALRQCGSRQALLAAQMLTAYGAGDPCLHDPCVIAGLLQPDCFTSIPARVTVDCQQGMNYGRTVAWAGPKHLADSQPNLQAVTAVDDHKLFQLLTSALSH